MKEKLKFNASTILLILCLIIILCMGVVICKLYNTKIIEMKTSSAEDVRVNSEYGEAISYYLTKTWLGLELYKDNMAEFQDIKSAPKDYLAYCAAWGIMEDNSKTEFSDFNQSLINIFGSKADNLIEKSDIANVGFVAETPDGTYEFSGFCGSETASNDYIIDKIKKENNIFTVTLYEYNSIIDDLTLDLENGDSTQRHIYDKKDNLILSTTIKCVEDDNTTYFKEYDENGNEIGSLQHLLLTEYENKLSIRTITLEYNSDNFSFIMLNNKLEK